MSIEFNANRLVGTEIESGNWVFRKGTVVRIDSENLDAMGIPAGNQQETAVRGDPEIPRMYAGIAVGSHLQCTVRSYPEDGNPVIGEPMGGVEELPGRMDVDVRASSGIGRIGLQDLDLGKDRASAFAGNPEGEDLASQFRKAVEHVPFGTELHVPGTCPLFKADGQFWAVDRIAVFI